MRRLARVSARRGRALERLWSERDLGEIELGPAARADGIVDLRDAPAVGALPTQLVALEAVQDGGQKAQHRDRAGDQEPKPEGAALDSTDVAARQAEADGDDHVGHAARATAERARPTPPPPRRG